MRRIAALYDIHGNLPALDAVLAEVRTAAVDAIVVGGDVLPGPMPLECLDALRRLDRPTHFISGNGERAIREHLSGTSSQNIPEQARESIAWTADQIDDDRRGWIATWPATMAIDVDGIGAVLFCHATPRNDVDIFTRLTPDERLRGAFAGVTAAVVVCGHTHLPFDRMVGSIRVVNAGSVGMPFGRTGADWLLLDGERRGAPAALRHTDYDLAVASDRIGRTAYPQAADFAERYVRTAPGEAAVLAAYAKSELT
jgi:predicted phosphodiesterase